MIGKVFCSALTIGLLSLGLPQQDQQPQTEAESYPVGQVALEEVMAFNEEYRELTASYTPDSEALTYLQHYPRKITIEVFYGGWCSDSRAHVPSFIKVLESVNNPNISTTFIAVDEGIEHPADLIHEQQIERVPTFIVYVGGREIGRIVETPEGRLEEHLVKILKSHRPVAKGR